MTFMAQKSVCQTAAGWGLSEFADYLDMVQNVVDL